jgi:hypothetical protein
MTPCEAEQARLTMLAALQSARVADEVAQRVSDAMSRPQDDRKAIAQSVYASSSFATDVRESREARRQLKAQYGCTQRARSSNEHLACDRRPRR